MGSETDESVDLGVGVPGPEVDVHAIPARVSVIGSEE